MHLAQAQIQAARPTDRAALRKTIQAALEAFEGQRIDCGKNHLIAVGQAQFKIDDTDAEWMRIQATYDHASDAHGPAKDGILSALGGMLHHDRLGPVGCWIEPMGGNTNGVQFEFAWRVRFPAAA